MVRTVLKYVAIGMVILLIGAWFWAGGWGRVVAFVKNIPNPIDILWGTATSTYSIQLPWQLPVPYGADISGLTAEGEAYVNTDPEERLRELQDEYDSLSAQAAESKDSGTRSPSYGLVGLSRANATDGDPSSEYLVVSSRSGQSVSISGWSVMSTMTGVRAMIPLASPVYELGTINRVDGVALQSGESAILYTGFSPLGVSFRENTCMGYIAQSKNLEPSLPSSCPAPSDAISLSEQNLQKYGGDCIDYVNSLPACTTPGIIPNSLPAACRIHIANTYSYQGCVQTFRNQSSFGLDTWRLYFGYSSELWGNRHDSLRLLDEYGRTVSTLTY